MANAVEFKLDRESLRAVKALTKALEKVARNMQPYEVDSALTDAVRLKE